VGPLIRQLPEDSQALACDRAIQSAILPFLTQRATLHSRKAPHGQKVRGQQDTGHRECRNELSLSPEKAHLQVRVLRPKRIISSSRSRKALAVTCLVIATLPWLHFIALRAARSLVDHPANDVQALLSHRVWSSSCIRAIPRAPS
jgi:hypothetical protein